MEISRTKIAIEKSAKDCNEQVDFDKIKKTHIVIVGCGGTGCNVANILCRLPFAQITLIDCDIVEENNLERQLVFSKSDIGKMKQEVMKEKLNYFDNITIISEFITQKNTQHLHSDLIIDCTDNFTARTVINEFSQQHKIPWIYTGAIGEIGTIFFQKPGSKNIMDFHNDKEETFCSQEGISAPNVALVAALASNIVLQYITKGVVEESLIRINLKTNEVRKIKVK